jgi:hypothetical protein
MNMRKRLITGIIVGLSALCIGVASISASAATTIGRHGRLHLRPRQP